jgi:hypothetical protein
MATVTDEQMRDRLKVSRPYTIVILKYGPEKGSESAQQILWEHGRRNFQLREEGILAIVCPIRDGTEISGIGIFAANETVTTDIMREDPAVKAGILLFETHETRSFPGDSLP